ncbi:MAG: TetR/AcrR family transcriptional regulator [Nitrospinales bacterium]
MIEKVSKAKIKIIEAASKLFYKQGYQATTIDQIIQESGVSRPTLYSHFSTKEDLCIVYLKNRRKKDLDSLKESIRKEETEHGKFMGVINLVREAMLSTIFRGCGYFNMISEFPDEQHVIVKEARVYVDGFREIIADGVKSLQSSNKKYKNIDVDQMTDVYYLIVCGAIMACQEYREAWPLDRAVKAVEDLLKP